MGGGDTPMEGEGGGGGADKTKSGEDLRSDPVTETRFS